MKMGDACRPEVVQQHCTDPLEEVKRTFAAKEVYDYFFGVEEKLSGGRANLTDLNQSRGSLAPVSQILLAVKHGNRDIALHGNDAGVVEQLLDSFPQELCSVLACLDDEVLEQLGEFFRTDFDLEANARRVESLKPFASESHVQRFTRLLLIKVLNYVYNSFTQQVGHETVKDRYLYGNDRLVDIADKAMYVHKTVSQPSEGLLCLRREVMALFLGLHERFGDERKNLQFTIERTGDSGRELMSYLDYSLWHEVYVTRVLGYWSWLKNERVNTRINIHNFIPLPSQGVL